MWLTGGFYRNIIVDVYNNITILRTNSNTMTCIERESVGIMILFNNIYKWYTLTYSISCLTMVSVVSTKYYLRSIIYVMRYEEYVWLWVIICICVWFCLSWVKYSIRVKYYHVYLILQIGVEYYLVCIREGLLCGKAWSHRKAAGG